MRLSLLACFLRSFVIPRVIFVRASAPKPGFCIISSLPSALDTRKTLIASLTMQLPSWLVWYKKPEYRDIREYSKAVGSGNRALSPDGRNKSAIPSRLSLERVLENKTCTFALPEQNGPVGHGTYTAVQVAPCRCTTFTCTSSISSTRPRTWNFTSGKRCRKQYSPRSSS